MIERTAQVDQLAFAVVGAATRRNKGSHRRARGEYMLLANIGRRGALGDVLGRCHQGQCDVNLFHCAFFTWKKETSSLFAALGPGPGRSPMVGETKGALGFEGPAAAGP